MTRRRCPLPPSPARDASKAPRSRPRTELPSPGSRDVRRFALSCRRSLSRCVSRRLSTAPACQRGLPATPKNHFLVSQAVRSAPYTDPKRLTFPLHPGMTLTHLYTFVCSQRYFAGDRLTLIPPVPDLPAGTDRVQLAPPPQGHKIVRIYRRIYRKTCSYRAKILLYCPP
jgi:hypothetical protein